MCNAFAKIALLALRCSGPAACCRAGFAAPRHQSFCVLAQNPGWGRWEPSWASSSENEGMIAMGEGEHRRREGNGQIGDQWAVQEDGGYAYVRADAVHTCEGRCAALENAVQRAPCLLPVPGAGRGGQRSLQLARQAALSAARAHGTARRQGAASVLQLSLFFWTDSAVPTVRSPTCAGLCTSVSCLLTQSSSRHTPLEARSATLSRPEASSSKLANTADGPEASCFRMSTKGQGRVEAG